MRQGQGGKFPPPSSEETDSNLTIGQTDYTLGAVEERTATVSFTAPAEWTLAVVYDDAESDADADEWLTVSPENGPAGEQTVELTADPKITEESRTAYVDIACGEETVRLTVTQTGISDETDFTDLFDPDFAKILQSLGHITDAGNITLDDMKNIAAVTVLDVSYSTLTSLQGIEYFESLTYLDCYNNQLTALDVSKNTALTWLYCYSNQLTALDVSKNTALMWLDCSTNQLTALDVSKNTALATLFCSTNQLTTLDVSKNTALTTLYCSTNQLTALDVSKNTALTYLYCYSNQLTALDVSKNTALMWLNCYNNQLTELDVSKNTALTTLLCNNNSLESLDVSGCTALTTLYCYSNQLTALDVSKNTALTTLYCYSNQLTALDVSKNTALTSLYCYSNQLTSLDVSKNTALKYLRCYSNQLMALDISKNTKLGELDCKDNPGDGESTFPVTVWDDFDLDNIPSNFTTEKWIYEGKDITPVYKKAAGF